MRKVIIGINEVDFGSTGSITTSVLFNLSKTGFETYLCCHEHNDTFPNEFIISKNKFTYFINKSLSRLDASDGFHSKSATTKLIDFLNEKKPSLLFLNNLHGSYINLPILLKWIKHNKIKVVWTLHDCWLFTGKCAHFVYAKCDKWKQECSKCPNLNTHPKAYLFDHSKQLFNKKKKLFEDLQDLITFVVPSNWLKEIVSHSFLKTYKCVLINNGINLPKDIKNLKSEERIVLMATGNPLTERKGLNFINRLAEELDENKFVLYAAGIPDNAKISAKVHNLGFLNHDAMMEYFGQGDAFINPTLEDSFPTSNIESLAMGTPVITFENNGGCEVIDKNVGHIIPYGDYESFKNCVLSLRKKDNDQIAFCIEKSKLYSINKMCDNYNALIKELVK